jgi:hypothetical protein
MNIHQTPYERPTFEDIFGPDDTPDAEDLRVDEHTLKARKYSSDHVAAIKATLKAAGFSDEVLKSFMTVMDAASRADNNGSKHRRFHCVDWVMALFHRRGPVPEGLSEDEATRRKASLARSWRRAWEPIHAEQCQTHIGFVIREPGKIINNKRITSAYEDRLTDVVNAVLQRARQIRARRIDRFDVAAAEVLEQFKKDFPVYAPEWKPPEPPVPTEEEESETQEEDDDPPEIQSFRRAVRRIRKLTTELPEDQAEAMRLNLRELIDEEWSGRTSEDRHVRPVFHDVDTKNAEWLTETIRESDLRAAATGGKCENAAENGPHAPNDMDKFVHIIDPEPEPRGQSLTEAEAALDAFVSVGARACVAVVVDDALPFEESLVSNDHLTVDGLRRALPYYLEHNLENETHSLCVRFAGKEPSWDWYGSRRLIQVDDCSAEEYARLLPFSFFAVRTSPSNPRGYQVWMALSDEITDHEEFKKQKRRLYGKLNPQKDPKGANGGAHGSVRWPGSLNHKLTRKYADGESPRVQLLSATPGRITSLAELDAAGLLAPPPKGMTPEEVRELRAKLPSGGWPDINAYLSRAGDRSGPECGWAMAAFKRGFPRHAIIAKLKEVGPKASTREDDYAEQTVTAAWGFLTEQASEKVMA